MNEEKLSAKEVDAMLKKLSKHFGEPVMPVGQYCAALGLWQHAIREKYLWLKKKLDAGEAKIPIQTGLFLQGQGAFNYDKDVDSEMENAKILSQEIDHVFMQIQKSNLLARLIYCGETLRTERCPAHQGFWSGCDFGPDGSECACQKMQKGGFDSNVTGWLP